MNAGRRWAIVLAAGLAAAAAAAEPPAPAPARCIVPAKPGGGFDVTCRLARLALGGEPPLPVVYRPGGIGALVFNEAARGRLAPDELVAFSNGTLLNLAQGRFGRARGPDDVRWLAALAMDHGVVAVHRDAPWRDLRALLAALKADPSAVAFAAGGTIGSQDWMKAALLARAAGVGHKAMRVVAFEGGGDAVQALVGRHVQVLPGDAAEMAEQLQQGAPLRLLAVLAPQRLPGALAAVPTAREQGVDLQWPILRGVYTSREAAPAFTEPLLRRLDDGAQQPGYARELARLGLQPVRLAGPALEREVAQQLQRYRADAAAFGLLPP